MHGRAVALCRPAGRIHVPDVEQGHSERQVADPWDRQLLEHSHDLGRDSGKRDAGRFGAFFVAGALVTGQRLQTDSTKQLNSRSEGHKRLA
jgi:hypothetical protein